MIISCNHLYKRFQGQTVLSDLSFDMDTKSDHPDILFYGPSGSGKTTLFRILMGLTAPDEGTIEILSGEAASGGLGLRFGTVFQENRLCEEFSALQNLCMISSLIQKTGAKKILQELLPEIPVEELYNKPVQAFSGGQKRRIAIARALLSHSDLLLMDEPFTGLDLENRHRVIDIIYKYKGHRPLLLASHETEGLPKMRVISIKTPFCE